MPPSPQGGPAARSGTVGYGILAHSDRPQLVRLVRALRTESPTSSVVIHWDASKEPLEIGELQALGNVHIVRDAIAVEWGSFALVDATLRTLRTALESTPCEWVVVLSGHDYPVAPVGEIERSLLGSQADVHIDTGQVVSGTPGIRWSRTYGGWLSRRYYFSYVPLPRSGVRVAPVVRHLIAKLAFGISKCQPFVMVWPMPPGVRWRIGVRTRRAPFGPQRPCRSGSQWMALSRKAAERVLLRIAEDTDLVAHFRRTVIPDEAFFQTILCAEPDLVVVDGNLRYEKWQGDVPSHPATLSRSDVASAVGSGMHFARKFVERADPSVLDEVDRRRVAHAERAVS